MGDALAKKVDRRSFLQGSLAVAGGALLGGGMLRPLGSGASTITTRARQAPVTLTFWDTNAGLVRTTYWQEIITMFQKQNPNITVQYNGLPIGTSDQKVLAAIAAGASPDLCNGDMSYIAGFAAENGLLPLDKYVKTWSDFDELLPASITAVRGAVANKKLYGLPFSNNLDVLYYRKDWFKQKGLEPPTTFPNFFKAATALTDPANNVYGFGLRGGSGSLQVLESWIFAKSGLTSFYDSNGQSVFDKPAAVAAVESYVSLYGHQTSKSDIDQTYTTMLSEFDSGHAAMVWHSLGSYAQNLQALGPDALGAVPPPALPSGRHVLVGGRYEVMNVFASTPHPEEAFKFSAYVCSPTVASFWNQGIGQIPPDLRASSETWVKKNVAINALVDTLAEKLTVAIDPPFYLPTYSALQTNMEPSLQKVMLGQMSASDFCTAMAAEYTQAQQQYNGK
jgi:multiple sugar transport system substrate-binding protein